MFGNPGGRDEIQKSFENEVRAISKLCRETAHPHIVSVFRQGEVKIQHYTTSIWNCVMGTWISLYEIGERRAQRQSLLQMCGILWYRLRAGLRIFILRGRFTEILNPATVSALSE